MLNDKTGPSRRGLFETLAAFGAGAALTASGGSARAAAVSENLAPVTKNSKTPIPVAVVLDQGATLVDFAGPWEMLGSAIYQSPGFNVYSVASTRKPVICDNQRTFSATPARFKGAISGLTVVPDYTFDDAPPPKIILVGGQSGAGDPKKMEWIRHTYRNAELAMSVCVGAFVLGNSGILDGHKVTTNARVYDTFAGLFPKTTVVRGVRFVESGNVATSTGLTAGIDLALRVIERYYGRDAAQKIAKFEEWKSTEWMVDG